MDGIERISAKGFDSSHDDDWEKGQLVDAAKQQVETLWNTRVGQ